MIKKTLLTGICIMLLLTLGLFVYGEEDEDEESGDSTESEEFDFDLPADESSIIINEDKGTVELNDLSDGSFSNFEGELGETNEGYKYIDKLSFKMNEDDDDDGVDITTRFSEGDVEIIEYDGKEKDDFDSDEEWEEHLDKEVGEDTKSEIEDATRTADKEAREHEDITVSDDVERHQQEMRHKFSHKGRSAILDVLNSWTEMFLGDLSMRVFAGICGDTMHVNHDKDTRHEGVFGSMKAPGSEYESELEMEATGRDKPTVSLSGEKNQVGENLYRYGSSMKLIGNQNDTWTIYLYNSCTKENSYDDYIDSDAEIGWKDEGRIRLHGFIHQHYAGHRDQSMIFDCEDENCRFDQVCVVFESTKIPGASSDNKEPEELGYGNDPYCVTLTHGEGFFTQGETGSYDC